MSLKPNKKSDLSKGWMKRRQDKSIRMQPEYHLIVTEGTKTEPQYFQRIQEIINQQYRGRIQLDIYGEGQSTLSLFDKAKRRVQRSSNIYRHVWIVYDTDDFPSDSVNQTEKLCKKSSSNETEYHAVWSNQCIELWFLLHFSYFHSDIHRKEYWPKLSDCLTMYGLGTYEKGRKDMYTVLEPYMDRAIDNAKKLDAVNHGRTVADSAPGTKVYELIEKLRPYLKND